MDYNREEIREKFKDIFEHSLDFIYINDLKGNFLDANDTALNNLGYAREEIQNISFINLLDKENLAKAIKATKDIIEKGTAPKHYDYKLKTKKGDNIYVRTNAIPLKKEGKIYAILGIGYDITDEKIAEQGLKESEEKYRVLFENSPYSIILIDPEGTIIDFNSTTTNMLGYEKKDYVGKGLLTLPLFDPKNPRIVSLLNERLKLYAKGKALKQIELKVYKKDGDFIWARPNVSLIEMGKEKVIQIILEDISQKIKAENLIREEVNKLKEIEKMRKDLISSVSHELKTPLMSINAASELLLNMYKDQLGENAFDLIGLIERGGHRLRDLIFNLLDSSRLDFNKLELKKSKVNISEMIQECANDMIYLINEREFTLELIIPKTFYARVDPVRFQQVISNLLSNAIKNTQPKGTITIILQKNEGWAEIFVKDTGVGFTYEEKKSLFTRFYKIDRQGEGFEDIDISGSGLGLFISKDIIKLHGGEIIVESEGRNKGSTFMVRFPMIKKEKQ